MVGDFFSNAENIKSSLAVGVTLANAALGTNISLPTAQIMQMATAMKMAVPYYQAKGKEALNRIKRVASDRKKKREEKVKKREFDFQRRQANQIPDIPSSPSTIPSSQRKRKPKIDINRPPVSITKATNEGVRRSGKINKLPKRLSELLKKSEKIKKRLLNLKKRFSLKAQVKKKISEAAEKVTAPTRKGTSRLLKSAWLNLIQSFGLTLLWINAHVFFKFVFGSKIFCKLGQEWIPEKVSKTMGTAGETPSKNIGIVEVIALLVLDLIVLAVLALIIVILTMVVYALIHPVDFFLAVWQDAMKIIKSLAGFK